MKIWKVKVAGQVHYATQSDELNRYGQPFIVCNCGRTGYGLANFRLSHTGSYDSPTPYSIIDAEIDHPPWFEREWSNRQEKRDYLSRVVNTKDSQAIERLLCFWYGHVPSTDPDCCQHCHARRKKGRRVGWRPQPESNDLGPKPSATPRPKPLPMSTTWGVTDDPPALPPSRPVHKHRSLTEARDCDICKRRRK